MHAVCLSSTSGMKESWLDENQRRTKNDYEGHDFLTRLAKLLTKQDVEKQQSSNFKEMMSGYNVFGTFLQCRKQRWLG